MSAIQSKNLTVSVVGEKCPGRAQLQPLMCASAVALFALFGPSSGRYESRRDQADREIEVYSIGKTLLVSFSRADMNEEGSRRSSPMTPQPYWRISASRSFLIAEKT
jgi:hypothetical protein